MTIRKKIYKNKISFTFLFAARAWEDNESPMFILNNLLFNKACIFYFFKIEYVLNWYVVFAYFGDEPFPVILISVEITRR